MDLVKFVQDEFVEKKDFPKFSSGDTITVYYEIREGQKTRTQFFKGVVIQIKGSGSSKTFTILYILGFDIQKRSHNFFIEVTNSHFFTVIFSSQK